MKRVASTDTPARVWQSSSVIARSPSNGTRPARGSNHCKIRSAAQYRTRSRWHPFSELKGRQSQITNAGASKLPLLVLDAKAIRPRVISVTLCPSRQIDAGGGALRSSIARIPRADPSQNSWPSVFS